MRGCPSRTEKEDEKGMGGITVDRELVCPAAPHAKCVAVGTYQGSCLGKGH